MLSTTFFPRIPYAAIHLVEPMLVHNRYEISPNKLELGAVSRRDIWPTHEDAYRSLKSRAAFREWADTELRNYVVSKTILGIINNIINYRKQEYGLRHLPTLDYPDKTGVTLKCSKIQEAVSSQNVSFLSNFLRFFEGNLPGSTWSRTFLRLPPYVFGALSCAHYLWGYRRSFVSRNIPSFGFETFTNPCLQTCRGQGTDST